MLCTAQLGGPVLKASGRVQYPLSARLLVIHDQGWGEYQIYEYEYKYEYL